MARAHKRSQPGEALAGPSSEGPTGPGKPRAVGWWMAVWKRRAVTYVAAGVLVLAGIAAYANATGGAFVLDDLPRIVHNTALRAWPSAGQLFAHPRPLVFLSLRLNYAIDRALGGGGLNPPGYHVFNIVVHLLAGLTLFGLARRALSGMNVQAARAVSRADRGDGDRVDGERGDGGKGGGGASDTVERPAKEGERAFEIRERQRRGGMSPASVSTLLALAISLLWVVHPLTTQAVTYVIQRAESMMGLFFLLSLYCVSRGAERGGPRSARKLFHNPPSPGRGRGRASSFRIRITRLFRAVPASREPPHPNPQPGGEGIAGHETASGPRRRPGQSPVRSRPLVMSLAWLAAAVLCGWASMACKQVAVVLPVVMLLYDRAFLSGSFIEALRRRWPVYVLVLIGAGLLLWTAFGNMGASGYRSAGFGATRWAWWQYAQTQPGVILHYLRLAVYPHPLVLDYDWPMAKTLWAIAPPAAGVGALVVATLATLWWAPRVGFLAASFFLVLAPTSSFMPIADMAFEQRMYLPLAAVMTLIVLVVVRLLRWVLGRGWGAVGLTLLAVAGPVLIATTIARNADYATQRSIWRDTIAKAPHNGRAHDNLGVVLAGMGRYEAAATQYREALRLEPDNARARVNLGIVLEGMGEVGEARRQYRKALAFYTNYPPALYRLGIVKSKARRLKEAARLYRRAVKAQPHLAGAWRRLGDTYFEMNRLDQAARAYRRAMREGGAPAYIHNKLGQMLAMAGRMPEAAKQFAAAVKARPHLAGAWRRLADAYFQMRRIKQAASTYRRAIREGADTTHVHDKLGKALAIMGRIPEAAKQFAAAVRLDPHNAEARADLARARRLLREAVGARR